MPDHDTQCERIVHRLGFDEILNIRCRCRERTLEAEVSRLGERLQELYAANEEAQTQRIRESHANTDLARDNRGLMERERVLEAQLKREREVGDDVVARNEELEIQLAACRAALERLYSETADYIRINHLGDVHHNDAMKMARTALDAQEDKK